MRVRLVLALEHVLAARTPDFSGSASAAGGAIGGTSGAYGGIGGVHIGVVDLPVEMDSR